MNRILDGMRSRVAEDLRDDTRARVLELSVDERIELAFRLGEEELENFASARGLDRDTALRILRRQRRAGRRYSRCIEELEG
jgi:hypothetical protein